jgi:hypothetical protein
MYVIDLVVWHGTQSITWTTCSLKNLIESNIKPKELIAKIIDSRTKLTSEKNSVTQEKNGWYIGGGDNFKENKCQ